MFEKLFKSNSAYKVVDVNGVKKLIAAKEVVTDKEEEKLKTVLRQEQAMLKQLEKLGIEDDLVAEVKENISNLETLIRLKEDLRNLPSTNPKDFEQNLVAHKKRFDSIIDNLKTLDTAEEKDAVKNTVDEGIVENDKKEPAKAPEATIEDSLKDLAASKTADGKVVTADKAVDPNNKKYKDPGIAEKLVYINKIVKDIKTDTPAETIPNADKGVITPGEKSSTIAAPTNKINPDSVVEKVLIKINRDSGEAGQLLNNPAVKFPKGDNIVSKASLYETVMQKLVTAADIDTQKLSTKTDEKKEEILNKINEAGKDETKIQNIVQTEGISKEASLFDQVQAMFITANVAEDNVAPELDAENAEDEKLKQDIADVVNLYMNEGK